jgi:hypothetical protein
MGALRSRGLGATRHLSSRGAAWRALAAASFVVTLSAGCPATLRLGDDDDAGEAGTPVAFDGGPDATCGDLLSDPENCGACGRRCPRGLCVQGICCIADRPASCPTESGPVCADLDTDPEHCGECGRACASGCAEGACCATGATPAACAVDGALRCVDLDADPANCGECGRACASGLCVGGECCREAIGGICVPGAFDTWSTPAPEEVRWVHLVDADYDGHEDLFATCQVGRAILHIPGRSDRDLRVRQRIDSGRVGPGFSMGDLDRDGAPDFVTAVQGRVPYGTELRIFDAVAGGSFEIVATLPEDTNPNWTTLLDVDADGRLDIAVRQAAEGCIAFRRSLGGYMFAPGECVVPYATAGEAEAIRAIDDDADGRAELYEIRMLFDGNQLWRHTVGEGRVRSSERVATPLGVVPQAFAVKDLDRAGDGRPDLVVLSMLDWRWRVVVRSPVHGPVEGELAHDVMIRDAYGVMSLTDVGDIDGDGVLDLVGFTTCGECPSNVYVLFGVL